MVVTQLASSDTHTQLGRVIWTHTPHKIQYLLHFGVILDVDLFASSLLHLHGPHSVQGDVARQLRPLVQSLGVDGRLDDLQHDVPVVRVHGRTGDKQGEWQELTFCWVQMCSREPASK